MMTTACGLMWPLRHPKVMHGVSVISDPVDTTAMSSAIFGGPVAPDPQVGDLHNYNVAPAIDPTFKHRRLHIFSPLSLGLG
jgi:hypothetical protein